MKLGNWIMWAKHFEFDQDHLAITFLVILVTDRSYSM